MGHSGVLFFDLVDRLKDLLQGGLPSLDLVDLLLVGLLLGMGLVDLYLEMDPVDLLLEMDPVGLLLEMDPVGFLLVQIEDHHLPLQRSLHNVDIHCLIL